ncbi:MAG TPA: AtpZ/AtpI family protein [Acidimicrobiia bacterium]
MRDDSITKQTTSAVHDGWMEGGSFFSSIIAGTLLGYLLDLWLGTDPWFVVIGVVLGSYAGFLKIWAMLKNQDGTYRER